jgi:antitoxin component YwqK of YwqJK toxin-antitoxin module
MGIFDFLKKSKDIENDNGLNEIYYDDGKGSIKEKYYKEDGSTHGLYQEWYENGKLKSEFNYKEGQLDGLCKSYYENGQLMSEGRFIYENRDGVWKGFFEDGTFRTEVSYRDGKVKCDDGKYRAPIDENKAYEIAPVSSITIEDVIYSGETYRGSEELINIISEKKLKAEHKRRSEEIKKTSGGLIGMGNLPFIASSFSNTINVFEWYDIYGKEIEITRTLEILDYFKLISMKWTQDGKIYKPHYAFPTKSHLYKLKKINDHYISDGVTLFTGHIDKKKYVDGLPLESDQLTSSKDTTIKEVKKDKKNKVDKKWDPNKKLTSWDDLDQDMLLVAEYRTRVLKDLFGLKESEVMQHHLRRITKLWDNAPKDQWQKIAKEYMENIPTANEDDSLRYKIERDIEKQKDIVKQNILIADALKKDPNHLELYNIKAYNLYELGKIEAGINTILKAIKIDSNKASFYDTAGEGYYMKGEYKEAIHIMSKGIKIAPDGLCPDGTSIRIEEHYYNRGMAYLKLKLYDKAKEDFFKTLSIDLGYKKAAYALREIPGYSDK